MVNPPSGQPSLKPTQANPLSGQQRPTEANPLSGQPTGQPFLGSTLPLAGQPTAIRDHLGTVHIVLVHPSMYWKWKMQK